MNSPDRVIRIHALMLIHVILELSINRYLHVGTQGSIKTNSLGKGFYYKQLQQFRGNFGPYFWKCLSPALCWVEHIFKIQLVFSLSKELEQKTRSNIFFEDNAMHIIWTQFDEYGKRLKAGFYQETKGLCWFFPFRSFLLLLLIKKMSIFSNNVY